ncbi:MAG TPA: prolipoprotein diacylglyceryl transferase [Stellaceae bacterium]|nr:prolipoprotein diacylglyceryl transferase [Stellaceae bacterium]
MVIPYPNLDPVAIKLGPLAIRWYALAYIAGLTIGWRYCIRLAKKAPAVLTTEQLDDLLLWVTGGVVIGGRIGYVLVYKPGMYLQDPLEILRVWHGGMSFHGGCAGVFLAIWLFARRHKLSVLGIGDLVACAVPIGLFFGRIANFVNGELWGRATDVPWAMIFPDDPEHLPRHPSQLYQAGLEGIALFVLLAILEWRGVRMRRGAMTGWFLVGYAVARSTGELFRQPDVQLGFIFLNAVTMGQILCIPMLAIGIWLIARAKPQAA